MNIYKKYCPNVFLAQCTEQHEKGDIIEMSLRGGRTHNAIVFNLVYEQYGYYYYSVVREDGFDAREHAKRRAERLEGYAGTAEKKSDEYYEKSNKHRDFLILGEPIKVGHHSEGRHRKMIDQAHNNMGRCIEQDEKAKRYKERAAYWESRADLINLSMPESLDFFKYNLDKAIDYHEGLKSGRYERRHSMDIQYANKTVNDLKKKLELAKKMWGEEI